MSVKLTKGQLSTLERLEIRAADVCDEALQEFFDYTDRGLKPARLTPWEARLWPAMMRPLRHKYRDVFTHGIHFVYRVRDQQVQEMFGRFRQAEWHI